MIKGQATTIIVQNTLKRLPLVRKRDFATMTTSNTSDDTAVRKQQAMLHSQRAKEEERQKKAEQAQKSNGRPAYFPMGYKQAVYEWVCGQRRS
jgi:hypothetical protein